MFSGATVIASLAAIWTIDSSALRSLALGAILVVAVSVLASTTLLLPLLRLLGRRAWEPGRLRSLLGKPAPSSFWASWTDWVTRRPIRAVALSALLLVALALPSLSIDMRSSVLGQLPRDHEARVGFDRAAKVLGPGVVGQARVLVTFPDANAPATASRAAALGRRLARDPAVASVGPVLLSTDGRSALLAVTPAQASDSPAAKAAVARWRRDLPAAAGPGAEIAVGGASAAQLDYENQVRGSMWRLLLIVLLVCYVVLVFLLRSLVVPLKAVIVNLLSVGAAYGVIVIVFQWGWLDGLFGYESPGSSSPRCRRSSSRWSSASRWTTRCSCSLACASASSSPATAVGRSPRGWRRVLRRSRAPPRSWWRSSPRSSRRGSRRSR